MDGKELQKQYQGISKQRQHVEDTLQVNKEKMEYLRGGKDKLLEVGQAKTTDVSGLSADEKATRITAWEARYLTGNPTFALYAKSALELPEKECDSSMQQVRSSLRNLITMEKVYRGLIGQNVNMDQLNMARTEFMDSCRNYVRTHHPIFSKARKRKSLVSAMLHISGEAQDVATIEPIVLTTANEENDEHIAPVPDTRKQQMKAMYERDLAKTGLSKNEKKALEALGAYLSFKKVGYHDEYGKLAEKAKTAVEACLSQTSTAISAVSYAYLLTEITRGGLPEHAEEGEAEFHEEVTVRDDDAYAPFNREVTDSHSLEKMHLVSMGDKKDVPLFGRAPSVQDIKQRALGDCYLLSALSSLAAVNPEAIQERMRDNGDGTVTVRFQKRYEPEQFRSYYLEHTSADEQMKNWCLSADFISEIEDKYINIEVAQWTDREFWDDDNEEYNELKAEWNQKVKPLRDEWRALEAESDAVSKEEKKLRAQKVDPKTNPIFARATELRKKVRAKRNEIMRAEADMQFYEKATVFYKATRAGRDVLSNKFAYRCSFLPGKKAFNIRGLTALYQHLSQSENEKDRYFATASKMSAFENAIINYTDEEWEDFVTRYHDDLQLSRNSVSEFVPLYVTVEKTTPQMKIYGDAYGRDALWVQMIEKAYAASGLRSSEFDAVSQSFVQSDLQKRYLELQKKSGENPVSEATKERIRQQIIHSYFGMEGGYGDEFLAEFLGADRHKNVARFITPSVALWDRETTEGIPETPTFIETIANSMQTCLNGLDDTQYPPLLKGGERDFFAFFNAQMDKQLTAVLKEENPDVLHIEEVMKALHAAWDENVQFFTLAGQRYAGGLEGAEQQNAAMAQLGPALEALKMHVIRYFEEGFQHGTITVAGFANLQYRPHAEKDDEFHDLVGKYTDEATQLYTDIAGKLARHIPVCAGTRSFKSDMKGPNGEAYADGIYGAHAYSVVGTLEEDGKKYLIMRNPHAMRGRGYEYRTDVNGEHSYKGIVHHGGNTVSLGLNEWRGKELPEGIFRMELNDFLHFMNERGM